jgi:hypothetical protein
VDALIRQAISGLGNGVLVLAFGGLFWTTLGLGLGVRLVVAPAEMPLLFPVLALLNPVVFALLLVAAFRVRRRAPGFKRAEIARADGRTRAESARVVRGFLSVVAGEAFLIALTGFLAFYLGRPELAWPSIGLIVGLHFVPLGRLFGVPTYYAAGVASMLVCIAALALFEGPGRTLVLGYGMGAVAWASAAHLVWSADALIRRWVDAGASRAA